MSEEREAEMSFLQHLEELRWHLIRAVAAVLVLATAAFFYHSFIFDQIILAPKQAGFFTNRLLCNLGEIVHVAALCINTTPLEIINIKMAGQFSTHISVSIIGGFIVSFPYVFWEIWRFMKPALYDEEVKHARGAVFFSSLLFGLGILFGYYLIVPLSVQFLGTYSISAEVVNTISLGSYISTVTSISLASGVIFELPVVIYFLSKVGLVTAAALRKYRRHSLVVILALSAIITPPDVFSQILVSLPLLVLYELGIVISKRIERKRNAMADLPATTA